MDWPVVEEGDCLTELQLNFRKPAVQDRRWDLYYGPAGLQPNRPVRVIQADMRNEAGDPLRRILWRRLYS